MNRSDARTDVQIRPYRPEDEDAVLALLSDALGAGPTGERSATFFRWKHSQNPFGPSLMLVAEADGLVVGLRAFMRWRFVAGNEEYKALRAVDTATHPDHQGRGIFRRLTLSALDIGRTGSDFVFNTPNGQSLPGYLKMGWHPVGKMAIRVRVRRPVRFVRRLGSVRESEPAPQLPPDVQAETADQALGDSDAVRQLLEEAPQPTDRLGTPKDLDYLRWRFVDAPSLDYRAVRVENGGRLRGLCLFRVRPRGRLWESTIAEVIVPAGDGKTALDLLRAVASAASVDHVACRFPKGSPAAHAATRWGAVTSPLGMTFIVNPFRPDMNPDPTELRSWELSVGDLEVF
jgi:GNAT superfamily N-acetyltransferase